MEKEDEPYPYVLTTLDKSICLGLDKLEGNIYYPKSLRIKGNIMNKTFENIYSVDFILSKTDIRAKFSTIHFREKNKDFPNELCSLVDITQENS